MPVLLVSTTAKRNLGTSVYHTGILIQFTYDIFTASVSMFNQSHQNNYLFPQPRHVHISGDVIDTILLVTFHCIWPN